MSFTNGRRRASFRGGLFFVLVAVLGALGTVPAAATARPGELDPPFGKGGRLIVPKLTLSGMASLPDGGIVVATQAGDLRAYQTGGPTTTLRVYLPNGRLDSRFGDGGISQIAEPTGRYVSVTGIALDGHRRIDVAGAATSMPTNHAPDPPQYPENVLSYAVIERYLPDGRLDSTFGTGGVVVTDLGIPSPARPAGIPDYAQPSLPIAVHVGGVAVDSRDRIVLTGTRAATYEATKEGLVAVDEAFVARLGPNGNQDPAFNGTGTSLPAGLTSIGRPSVDRDDGVYFTALPSSRTSPRSPVLGRLSADGVLDPGFGKRGWRQLPFERSLLSGQNLALSLDGKGRLLVLGPTRYGSSVERLKPDGSLDRRFGREGVAIVSRTRGEELEALALTPTGHIVVVGTRASESPQGKRIARVVLIWLDPNGRLERRFGESGRTTTGFGARSDAEGSAVVVDAAGDAVAGGAISSSGPPKTSFFLARYQLGS